jgi:hypothetical protein
MDRETNETGADSLLERQPVHPVGLHLSPVEDHFPDLPIPGNLHRHPTRTVALEVTGVHHDRFHLTGQTETKRGPVVTRAPSSLRLPAIPHPDRIGGAEQIGRRRVVEVGRLEPASSHRCFHEVDRSSRTHCLDVGDGLTLDPEPGHSSVREYVETDDDDTMRELDVESESGVAL